MGIGFAGFRVRVRVRVRVRDRVRVRVRAWVSYPPSSPSFC